MEAAAAGNVAGVDAASGEACLSPQRGGGCVGRVGWRG